MLYAFTFLLLVKKCILCCKACGGCSWYMQVQSTTRNVMMYLANYTTAITYTAECL
jgi:hypothetical protein